MFDRLYSSLCLLLLATPALAQAPLSQGSAETAIPFDLIGTFVLELDGEVVDDALLYHSPQRPGIVVRTPDIETPFVLVPQGRQLEIFPPGAFTELADRSIALPAGILPERVDSFQLVDGAPSFTIAGRRGRLVARPHFLGPGDREAVMAHNPAYRMKAERFRPVPEQLAALEQVQDAVRVKVYFGSWCSVCSELMPGILKVDQELAAAGAPFVFEYYGLPQGYDDPEARENEISNVPTGLIWVNGRSMGRIQPQRWRYPSLTLINAIDGTLAGAVQPE